MKRLITRFASILLALMVMITMMPMFGAITDGKYYAGEVYAETEADVEQDGFKFHLWINEEGNAASVALRGYTGTGTEVILPTTVTYGGTTFKTSDGSGFFFLEAGAFAGNTSIEKIAIPPGYDSIAAGSFAGCTALKEVAISDEVIYLEEDIFDNCSSLTTYYFSGQELSDFGGEDEMIQRLIATGFAQGADGQPLPGVTVYTTAGSVVEKAIEEINSGSTNGEAITVKTVADPYSMNTVNPAAGSGDEGKDPSSGSGGSSDSGSGSSGSDSGSGSSDSGSGSSPSGSGSGSGSSSSGSGSSTAGKATKGTDGTAYGKGAAESVVHKALVVLKSEKDPKGTVFNLLQLKASIVKKTSITIKWKKVPNAKKYVIYGNLCGKTKKLVKLKTIKSSKKVSQKFTKVNKKKVAKGKYYKFLVVALDKNNKVLSTSKIIHVATKGGKYCNDKKVTTKAKNNKVTVKVGKKFKLGAKAVKESKSKKTQSHRLINYESSNKKIATVTSKGVIKGKKKGTCYVYAYAQNGYCAKVKVTVKKK